VSDNDSSSIAGIYDDGFAEVYGGETTTRAERLQLRSQRRHTPPPPPTSSDLKDGCCLFHYCGCYVLAEELQDRRTFRSVLACPG